MKYNSKAKKGLVTKKNAQITPSTTSGQKDQERQEFLVWLSQKLGIEDPNELSEKLSEMGEEGIKEAYMQFKQEKASQPSQMFKTGGKLDHLKKLANMKKNKNKPCCEDTPEKKQIEKIGTAEITPKKAFLNKKK